MWIVYALLAAVSAAIVTTLTKAGLKDADPNLAFAIQSLLIIVVSWGTVAVQGNLKMIYNVDGRTWMFLIIAGICTAASSLFSFNALKLANASMANPLQNTAMAFAVLFAALFLKEKITWQIITGVVMILGGALLIALSKKQ